VFAALFGYLFAHEILSINGYIGAALVLFSVILSTVKLSNPVKNRLFISNPRKISVFGGKDN
jgi:drug/metabolite transporter (DMT)-like permease